MLRRLLSLLLPLIGSAIAVWLSTLYVPGITITTDSHADTARTVIIVAVIIGVVNLIIKPVAKLFTFALRILTLGLFSIVLNGALLYLVSFGAGRFDIPFTVESFWPGAIVGAVFIGVVAWALNHVGEFLLKKRPRTKTKTVYVPTPPPPPAPAYPVAPQPQPSSGYAVRIPPPAPQPPYPGQQYPGQQYPPQQYPPQQYPPQGG